MNKNRVSIVIPAYNEAEQLHACLQAIAKQTVLPHEVIVVDNNSSDDTARVASYYDFVKLLSEPRQGVVFARDRGFNAASGEIIGRIDADSRLRSDWVERVQQAFSDPKLGAVTGKVHYYNMSASPLIDRIDLFFRRYMAKRLGREVALQGANMAIRRSAWRQIKQDLCHSAGLHEDFDVAIHANWRGWSVKFSESLVAGVSYRQSSYRWGEFVRYALTSPRTYHLHRLKSRRHMYPIIWLVVMFYWPLKLLARGYDEKHQKFAWSAVFGTVLAPRVNPASFVD